MAEEADHSLPPIFNFLYSHLLIHLIIFLVSFVYSFQAPLEVGDNIPPLKRGVYVCPLTFRLAPLFCPLLSPFVPSVCRLLLLLTFSRGQKILCPCPVAPHAGALVETASGATAPLQWTVAPHAGALVETLIPRQRRRVRKSRLTQAR